MATLAKTMTNAAASADGADTIAGGGARMMRLGGTLASPMEPKTFDGSDTDPEWRDPQAYMPRRPGEYANEGIMSYNQPVTQDWVRESERRLDLMTKRRRPF